MCYLEKREYRIQPGSGYRILRGCSGCGGRSVYCSTGNFRVNANGRQIDVWLIYQCEKCGHTYNLAVYKRVAPKDIPREEYRRFLENDKEAALWWGTRKEVFAKNRAEIDWERISFEIIPVDIPVESQGGEACGCGSEVPASGALRRKCQEEQERSARSQESQEQIAIGKRLLIIDNPYELKLRADKVVAEICHITRSRVRQLLKEGKFKLAQNYVGRRAEIELPEGLGF